MNKVFFPGCRIKAGYPEASEALRKYMQERHNLTPVNCCKVDYTLLNEDTKAVLICNNCAADLRQLTDPEIEYVYTMIDRDKDFIFPDYHGLHVYLQDCHHGYGDYDIETTVRSLLTKMNITFTALPAVPYGIDRSEHRSIVTQNAESVTGPVITYCAICNLAMKNANKETYYLPELLFNTAELR